MAVFGLQAIDMVYTDYTNTEGLIVEATQGNEMGYAGKQVIHPNQIGPVQAAFTPDDGAIEPRAAHHGCDAGAPGGRPRCVQPGWQDDRHAAGEGCRTGVARTRAGGKLL